MNRKLIFNCKNSRSNRFLELVLEDLIIYILCVCIYIYIYIDLPFLFFKQGSFVLLCEFPDEIALYSTNSESTSQRQDTS